MCDTLIFLSIISVIMKCCLIFLMLLLNYTMCNKSTNIFEKFHKSIQFLRQQWLTFQQLCVYSSILHNCWKMNAQLGTTFPSAFPFLTTLNLEEDIWLVSSNRMKVKVICATSGPKWLSKGLAFQTSSFPICSQIQRA